jgi:AraC family transcriptional regulator, L-rhamnose operon transcriptional activator RhaR
LTTSPERVHGRDVFSDGPLPIYVRRHYFTGDLLPHDHEFLEAVLILSGSGTHRTAQGDVALKPGSVLFLRPGNWHAYSGCESLDYYNCCFGTELLRSELRGILDEPLLAQMGELRLGPDDLDLCLKTLDAISAASSALEKLGYLLVFLARLAQCIPRERATSSHPGVLTARTQLEANTAHLWTLQELAAIACLEPTYFVRRFRADTGLPPMAWLARLRAEQAATLLLQTELSVQEIGERVGWSDLSYFARRFRMHFGCSPSAYRVRLGQTDAISAGLAY